VTFAASGENPISPARVAALREAVERADILAAVQARLIDNQQKVIELYERRIASLEGEVAEFKTYKGMEP
jgi:hypothetical protein